MMLMVTAVRPEVDLQSKLSTLPVHVWKEAGSSLYRTKVYSLNRHEWCARHSKPVRWELKTGTTSSEGVKGMNRMHDRTEWSEVLMYAAVGADKHETVLVDGGSIQN